MASRFRKIWSGADFWDEEENKRQRDQFAREDREEERRRRRAAAARASLQRPGTVIPSDAVDDPSVLFDPKKPLIKVGSQSNFAQDNEVERNTAANRSFLDKLVKFAPSAIADTFTKPEVYKKAPRANIGSFKGSGIIEDFINSSMNAAEGVATVGSGDIKKGVGKIVTSVLEGPAGFVPVVKTGQILSKAKGLLSKIRLGSKAGGREGALFTGAYGAGSAAEEDAGAKDIVTSATMGAGLGYAGGRVLGGLIPPLIHGAKGGYNLLRKASDAIIAARNAEAPIIPGIRRVNETPIEAEKAIEVAGGVKSTNLPKVIDAEAEEAARLAAATRMDETAPPRVPDVTNPIVLAKADKTVPVQPPTQVAETPIADFSKSINAPLQKVEPTTAQAVPEPQPTPVDIAQAAAEGDLRVSTQTDAEGNPLLVSDAEAARQLAEAGVTPQRGDSPVAANEAQMARAADQAAREEVNLEGTAAPRTREQLINRVEGEERRAELIATAPQRERVVLAEAENRAKTIINNTSDEDLIKIYQNPQKMETPDDLFMALVAENRLQRVDTPEAHQAIRNIIDATAEKSSESGLWQRASQVLFDDMSTPRKVDYLVNHIDKARRKAKMTEMTDEDTTVLLRLIEQSDAASDDLRVLQDEASSLLESGAINNVDMADSVVARADELSELIGEVTRIKELRAGEAWKFYQESLPKTALGKRTGDVGRTLMLSAPSGRAFDILSTTSTTIDDLLTRSLSGLIGKGVNLVKGRGTVASTVANPRQLIKGLKEGAGRVRKSFKGEDFVEDFMGAARRSTRGEINTGGGIVRRTVRAAVEAPTQLTRGIRQDELYRQSMQEAAQQGLKGEAQRTYAQLRSSVPSKEQLHQAVETHMRTNMLHDNAISRTLNNIANSLDKKGGGWAAPLIRNQIVPFTSWLGGNLHRTVTDKNVVWNVGSAINNIRKGNLQGTIADMSKFAVNSAQAYAVGYLLTEAGVLSTTDANGDSYAGLYFKVGNRYIPVAVSGVMSLPIILGNAAHQGVEKAREEGGGLQNVIGTIVNEAGGNALKNAGVAGVLGGQNTLQSAVAEGTREGGDLFDAAAEYAGGLVRQYIPGITADINSGLDQTALNPTGEATDTRVTKINPETGREKTDVLATEITKMANRIPFVSQGIDRKEGTVAKNLVDRMLKGTRETGEQAQERETKESLKDMEKRLRRGKVPLEVEDIEGAVEDGNFDKAIKGYEYQLAKAEADPNVSESKKDKIRDEITQAELQRDGVPVNDDGIKARAEEGEYDSAIRGLEYKLGKLEDDKDVPDSKRKEVKDDLTRITVTKEGNYPPAVIELYSKTSLSEWRALGNPESEDYDLELYELLFDYDAALSGAGVSRSEKSGEKPKFFAKAGRGGKGGRSAKAAGYTTDIARQIFRGGEFTPQKALPASFATPESVIPVLEKVPNYDRSKLKKISVTKGGIG